MIELAAVCLALVAALVYSVRVAARDREAAAKERAELYQRIQAPEVAIDEAVKASRGPRRRPRPIAADDDAAFARRREEEAERGHVEDERG